MEALRNEALRARDSAGFTCIEDAFQELANYENDYDLGRGWKLSFDVQYTGFKLKNPGKLHMIPYGMGCCPVTGCGGMFFGGVECEHVPAPYPPANKSLFRNHVWCEKDFVKLKELLMEKFKTKMYEHESKWSPSVISLLRKNGSVTLDEFNVTVSMDNANQYSLRVEMRDCGIAFQSCNRRDCNMQGLHADMGAWWCDHHKPDPTTFTWKSDGSTRRKYRSEAFQEFYKKANGKDTVNLNDTEGWVRMLQMIRKEGVDGAKYDTGEGLLIVKITRNKLAWKTYSSRKLNYICMAPFCYTRTGASAAASYWCETHKEGPFDVELIK